MTINRRMARLAATGFRGCQRVVGGPRLGFVWVFVAMFSFFLLTSSGEPPWNDAQPLYATAEHLVETGEFGVPIPGRSGARVFPSHPILPMAIHIPGAWLAKMSRLGAPSDLHLGTRSYSYFARVIGSHVGPAAAGALAVVLFMRLLMFGGMSRGVGFVGAFALGVTTIFGFTPEARIPRSSKRVA